MVSKFKKLLSKYRKFLFGNYRGNVSIPLGEWSEGAGQAEDPLAWRLLRALRSVSRP